MLELKEVERGWKVFNFLRLNSFVNIWKFLVLNKYSLYNKVVYILFIKLFMKKEYVLCVSIVWYDIEMLLNVENDYVNFKFINWFIL